MGLFLNSVHNPCCYLFGTPLGCQIPENYISRLALERLGVSLEQLAQVAGEREVSLLRLLPHSR